MSKRKGCNAERELIHLLWGKKWAAIRVAGSGSSVYPSPDILASNAVRRIALEVKSTKDESKYLTKQEVEQLKEFSQLFGAEAWIGVRFNRGKWYFLNVEDLRETNASFMVNIKTAQNKGLELDDLIS